jgi:hypothetical protein
MNTGYHLPLIRTDPRKKNSVYSSLEKMVGGFQSIRSVGLAGEACQDSCATESCVFVSPVNVLRRRTVNETYTVGNRTETPFSCVVRVSPPFPVQG